MSLRRFFSVLVLSGVAICAPSLLLAQSDAAPKDWQLFTVSPQVQHPAEQFCTHRGRRTRLQGDSPILDSPHSGRLRVYDLPRAG